MEIENNSKEEIGYYSGILKTLIDERNELVKLIQEIDGKIENYKKLLKELGVEVEISDKNE